MAKAAVEKHQISIRLACVCLCISETCYRYEAKLDVENQRIADWLLRLTEANRKWGFGLCYPIFAQREALYLESQAGLLHPSGTLS